MRPHQNSRFLAALERRRFLSLCAASLALAAAGCQRDRHASLRASTLTLSFDGDEECFSPAWQDVTRFLVFLPLTSDEVYMSGLPQPVLAERWDHSVDFREWTIHLRRGVKWHDGVPVTAHDVKFTIELMAREPRLGAGSPRSVIVENDYTLHMFYDKPSRDLLGGWNVYYPRHLLAGLDPDKFWTWDFWLRPIGNGPYRYVRHVPKTMVELQANPDYYRGKPRIERVVLKFGESSLAELTSGNVDALHVAPQAAVLKLADNSRFRVYPQAIPFSRVGILWNHRNPLFAEAAVRRALTLAIDRRQLHQVLSLPAGIPITDDLYTVRQFVRGDVHPALPYDPNAAGTLLAGAGWRQRAPGAVRERNGRPFRFTLLVTSGPWLAEPTRSAVFIQDQLRRVGVAVDIQTRDVPAARQLLKARRFEAAIYMTAALPSRETDAFGPDSITGYANPRVTQLLDQAKLTMDPGECDRIYTELAKIFREELPATFLFPKIDTHIAHRRVRGLSSPYRADPIWHAADLWLEDER